jgi:two-component system chemotaxis response regulator CheB
MTEDKIKVIIADDSGFMRLLISDILAKDPQIDVIDTAKDGKEALEKTKILKPDVLLLDMLMPEYDGVYAVREIMKSVPTPIVILSSLGHSNINPIMECLELGAFDYLNKPNKNSAGLRGIDSQIIAKVKQAAVVDMGKLKEKEKSDKLPYDIITIGSSTGGPSAVEQVITKLPSNLAVPVIIVQHMPENFVPSFATRLNDLIPLEVKVGMKDMVLEPGKVIIAPGHRNMIVAQKGSEVVIDFTTKKYKDYNHPSVNALMESVAEVYGGRSIGVILTGMGRDGTLGMKAIKEKGGYTIAQNKETSVVYGMPREAVESGCIDSIIPVYDIGGFLISCLS